MMMVIGRPGRHKQTITVKDITRGGQSIKRNTRIKSPTPADEDVPPEVFLLEDEGESEQRLQVHALHQQPEVVGQDAELEERHCCFTGRLQDKNNHHHRHRIRLRISFICTGRHGDRLSHGVGSHRHDNTFDIFKTGRHCGGFTHTVDMKQWSRFSSEKRTSSLMKTALALRMNEKKRLMWM